MATKIHVKECDNELMVIAYQWGVSYELCRITSTNRHVDVTLNLTAGPYIGPTNLNYVNSPAAPATTLYPSLPAGQYSLLLVGLNWGGPTHFDVSVNNVPHQGGAGIGLAWNPGPIAIAV